MSGCCSSARDEACSLPESKPSFCPACGQKGKSVATLTVKNLVLDHTRVATAASYSFCRTPDCSVVYFADERNFYKSDIKVRVGIKEQEDPIPLCYCFGYTRENVRSDLEEHGATGIPEKIKAEIQSGFCACEVKNPSGDCCLGNLTKTIQDVQKKLAHAATHS